MKRFAAIAASLATAACVLVPGPTVASPDRTSDEEVTSDSSAGSAGTEPGDEYDAEMAAFEDAAYEVASEVYRAVDYDPDAIDRFEKAQGRDTGFVGVSLAHERRALVVYWYGAGAEALDEVAAVAARSGVNLEVRPAKYSMGTTERAVRNVRDSAAAAELGVVVVGPRSDGSGLNVAVRAEEGTEYRAVRRELASIAGIDVASFAPVELSELTNRLEDTSGSVNGGARIERSEIGKCTSGWPIRVNGDERITTAEHCGIVPGYEWYNDFGTQAHHYGENDDGYKPIDTMTIDRVLLGNSPYIWTGSYYSTTRLPIRTYGTPAALGAACISGSFSGASCGNTIAGTHQHFNVDGVWRYPYMFVYSSLNVPGIAGPGDSGSPLYRVSADGGVIALGSLHGGFTSNPDPIHGVPPSNDDFDWVPDYGGVRQDWDDDFSNYYFYALPPEECRGVQEAFCSRMIFGPHVGAILNTYRDAYGSATLETLT